MTKLSIIVPVYNVEKYIRTCFESIFKQGIDDEVFEVIIVNDGTKDKSMEMIADIINQHTNVTIINQENQGLSVARNNGMAIAKGEYLLMLDSDDLLIDDSLMPLLEKAIDSQADLIVADFLKIDHKDFNQIKGLIKQKDFSVSEKNGERLFLEDLNPHECYVWRTLYKKELITNNQLKFFPKIRYQDIPFTHECYLKAGKCLRTSWLLNIYRKRPEAATTSFGLSNAKDLCIAIAKTWELTYIKELSSAIRFKLQEDIWTSFVELLRHTCNNIKDAKERILIIDFIREKAPNLYFRNNKKQITASFIFRKMPHTFIRLYYIYVKLVENKFLPFYHHKFKTFVVS